ncbi:hypothetical protein ACFQJD_17270 [Haloplanus sp. GCM10025708]|uniref:hypothetical protein n=1 Tax=Haloferacaceae TaxID=1644056 RepID=UPI003615482D
MARSETRAADRWTMRGCGAVVGLATGTLTVFATPAGLPLYVTLAAMIVVGGVTGVQAARQRYPSEAGAVGAGVTAVLLVLAGISTAAQTFLASRAAEGVAASALRRGSLVLAGVAVLLGLFAAAVSYFFRKRARRQHRLGE